MELKLQELKTPNSVPRDEFRAARRGLRTAFREAGVVEEEQKDPGARRGGVQGVLVPGEAVGVEVDGPAAMRHAIRLSQEKMDANCGGPFGAVVVKDGKIVAEGWNQVTSA